MEARVEARVEASVERNRSCQRWTRLDPSLLARAGHGRDARRSLAPRRNFGGGLKALVVTLCGMHPFNQRSPISRSARARGRTRFFPAIV